MTAEPHSVHFDGITPDADRGRQRAVGMVGHQEPSARSMISAPGAPPEQHRRSSLQVSPEELAALNRNSLDDAQPPNGYGYNGGVDARARRRTQISSTFGGVSKRAAYREIRRAKKTQIIQRRGWSTEAGGESDIQAPRSWDEWGEEPTDEELERRVSGGKISATDETTPLKGHLDPLGMSSMTVTTESHPKEALIEMFTENKINVLLAFLPLAYWSHAANWSAGSVFVLNFLAMVPLASMLGVFTEELAAHTNDVMGGLINATFGNAVELVVAIQALLANDYRVVQASLIGSVFSNLLLVLGMCFFCGGMRFAEQEFIAQGAVASIALLAFSGLALLMPEFFGEGETEDGNKDVELTISRMGAVLLVLMYGQLLFFQLNTHVHLFEGDDDVVALIPFSWALVGLVVITAVVTVLSEYLVGSIDGFCEEFGLGRSFVGVIILPVVGNAVEHISAVSVAMKNKMDLALGVALGSAVQIALFVLPMVVVIGWFTGREMSMKFPSFEVYLYLLSVIIVSLCLSNQRSNWLEGSLLVFTYALIAIGIYYEKDDIENSGA